MPHVISTPLIKPLLLRNVLDVLIIRTGTAGLSAALALGHARRSAIVFDGAEFQDNQREILQTAISQPISEPIQEQTIAEIDTKFRTIIFSRGAASSIRVKGMVFEVEDVTGRTWKERKVILALNGRGVIPDIPGYEEAWGTSM
ncbi:hypothetical protein FGADI_392 [Fusarium gaditjirri]|uniref:Thioredoxin reductase n=1 Tax=Fusarium gaditjirri TaxID=282569 RepID=A0A8H4X4X9_9HYPO|nr:hypothetical protein FGADI_392 [Fusarium gaditjirri]